MSEGIDLIFNAINSDYLPFGSGVKLKLDSNVAFYFEFSM